MSNLETSLTTQQVPETPFAETGFLLGDHRLSTIAELVNDPVAMKEREQEQAFVERYPFYDDPTMAGSTMGHILAPSEAELLSDFHQKMAVIAKVMRARGGKSLHKADLAESLQQLPFLGNKEVKEAAQAMAKHWQARIAASP